MKSYQYACELALILKVRQLNSFTSFLYVYQLFIFDDICLLKIALVNEKSITTVTLCTHSLVGDFLHCVESCWDLFVGQLILRFYLPLCDSSFTLN